MIDMTKPASPSNAEPPSESERIDELLRSNNELLAKSREFGQLSRLYDELPLADSFSGLTVLDSESDVPQVRRSGDVLFQLLMYCKVCGVTVPDLLSAGYEALARSRAQRTSTNES